MPTDRETTKAERIEAARRLLASVDKHADASPLILTTIARDLRTIRPLLAAALTPAPPEPPAGMAEVEQMLHAYLMAWRAAGYAKWPGVTEQAASDDARTAILSAVRSILSRAETAEAALASLRAEREVPEGWKLVPIEPTSDMLAEADTAMVDTLDSDDNWLRHARNAWGAMLAAAPEPHTLISAQKEPRNG